MQRLLKTTFKALSTSLASKIANTRLKINFQVNSKFNF
jgi:hypothetical protein